MRKALITITSLAMVVGSLGLAPAALAANETAQFSSLSSGAQPSGVITETIDPSRGGDTVRVDFPKTLFSATTWNGIPACNSIGGITVSVNGTPRTLSNCINLNMSTFYLLSVTLNSPLLSTGDRVTLTWPSGFLTNIASLAGGSVSVGNGAYSTSVSITLLPSPPSATATPIPMWQQAIGRASATASCPDGYTGSWDTWPNGGTGGYVCNRFVPAYGN